MAFVLETDYLKMHCTFVEASLPGMQIHIGGWGELENVDLLQLIIKHL